LEHFPEARICNIDRDCAALAVSKKLTDSLVYGQRMTFSCEDVDSTSQSTSTNWKDFDVVFFAALVGMDTDTKHAILASLVKKMRPGALVVARSARGMRGVLYPVGLWTFQLLLFWSCG
jgi:nicotianamine synthase